MKVMLKPGTEIGYTTLDAMLPAGLQRLDEGAGPHAHQRPALGRDPTTERTDDRRGQAVHVRIVPGALGSFFMEIENSSRVRVLVLRERPPTPEAAPPAGH